MLARAFVIARERSDEAIQTKAASPESGLLRRFAPSQ